jgi:hypothetical protein
LKTNRNIREHAGGHFQILLGEVVGVVPGSEGMGKRMKGERLGGVEKEKVETSCDQ